MVERLGAPLIEPIFEELAIIGVGLIGSSIARVARRRNAARRIILADQSITTLERAKALGLGDVVTDDAARAVRNADCVILCVPVGAYEAVARVIAPALGPGTIVSDVGSVKGAVISSLQPLLPAMRVSCRGIRWRGRNSRGQTLGSRASSSTGGAF